MSKNIHFKTKTPLFTESKHFFQSDTVPMSLFESKFKPDINIAIPLVIDAEFYAPQVHDYIAEEFQYRQPITIQYKHAHHPDEQIKVHPSFVEEICEPKGLTPRHAVAKHPFVLGDYLEEHGHDVAITRHSKEDLEVLEKQTEFPTMRVVMYAHFALADVGMCITDPDFENDLAMKFAFGGIKMNRRLTCGRNSVVKMPWLITVDGFTYRIAFQIVDTVATHGQASYKEFCANSGIKLDAKDLMKDHITQMHKAYFEVPDIYDEYALGDLRVHDALIANYGNMERIWSDMGLGDYFENPKLTIGATVSKLFENHIFKTFDIAAKDKPTKSKDVEAFFEDKTYKASALYLSGLINSNAFLLSKCNGGRCKSNNPLITAIQKMLCDIDIAGAYGGSMSVADYPFGIPVIYATKFDRKDNKGVPFREVFRGFKSELVDGLWTMVIKTDNLKYDQDFIPSWFDYNRTRTVHSVTDEVTGEVDLDSGTSKIFTRQVIDGVLTADILDVINQWTPRHRDDFLDKTEVLAMAFYPRSHETTVEKFQAGLRKKRYSSRSIAAKKFEQITQESHTWCRIPLGDFTDLLRVKRSEHPKKTPLNTLYKLLCNTTYGVQVSRFFPTANVIIGNQITAKVRAFMYLSEKALNLQGSITDGHVFDIDKVLHRKNGQYLHTENLARLYAMNDRTLNKNNGGVYAPLPLPDEVREKLKANFDSLIPTQSGNPSNDELQYIKSEIDRCALEHVANFWPKSKLLHGDFKILDPKDGVAHYVPSSCCFEFEMKQFSKWLVVHGSSNYSFEPTDPQQTKFRSYESKRPHQAFLNIDGNPTPTADYSKYNPAQFILLNIRDNPQSVKLPLPFLKTGILKPAAYKNNYRGTWAKSPLLPGDNILKVGRPSYFSLSQFTYRTLEQYNHWKKCAESLKRKYGYAFEIFFINKNGTLNYKKMIKAVDASIRKNVIKPMETFDPNRHRNRAKYPDSMTAPVKTADELRHLVQAAMQFDEVEDEFELIDTSDVW